MYSAAVAKGYISGSNIIEIHGYIIGFFGEVKPKL
jgi:hypothetical protein